MAKRKRTPDPKPLNPAERTLLDAFLEFLRNDDAELFRARCELLDAMVAAAKAIVRIEQLTGRKAKVRESKPSGRND